MNRQLQISSRGSGIAQSSGLRAAAVAAAAVHAGGLAAAAGEAWPDRRAYAGPPDVTSAVAASHAALGSAAPGSQRLGTAWRAAAAGPTCACTPNPQCLKWIHCHIASANSGQPSEQLSKCHTCLMCLTKHATHAHHLQRELVKQRWAGRTDFEGPQSRYV